jgi:hypothetical protein
MVTPVPRKSATRRSSVVIRASGDAASGSSGASISGPAPRAARSEALTKADFFPGKFECRATALDGLVTGPGERPLMIYNLPVFRHAAHGRIAFTS